MCVLPLALEAKKQDKRGERQRVGKEMLKTLFSTGRRSHSILEPWFHQWRKQSSERERDLPKVTQRCFLSPG